MVERLMTLLTRPGGSVPEDFHLSRRTLGALIFTGYAAAALSAHADPIVTDTAGLKTDKIFIPRGDELLPAFIARPDGPGRHPAVLVVSEVFGVHAYIQDICRRLAKLGYVAIAPAFFFRDPDGAKLPELTDFKAIIKIVSTAKNAQVMGDVGATLHWLEAQPFVDANRLAVTGFCWGGAVAWMACAQFPELKAGAAWYGHLTQPAAGAPFSDDDRKWPIDIAGQLKAPVLGLYGGKDPGNPLSDVEAMRARLKAVDKTGSDIIVYPEAQHGFHADYRSSYDPAAAKDGWSRMLAFFAAHHVAPAMAHAG
jgi:carboxymethylenebutenolidase